jgi:predicted adenine nucleotide alpha hydrolase (AANH) superfamily ATPase
MNILLHICCANCAIYPVKILREQNHQVTGFFFNPNIHPYQEFKRRLDTVRDYAERTELPMAYRDDYLLEEFLAQTAAAPGHRCGYCYHLRMEETARFAAGNGFEGFSTSLLYSRFQNHETIREYGQALGQRYGLVFHYQDFRAGWKEGIDTSKAMGLYRQQYCGCIYSEKDRYHPRSSN